MNYLQRNDKGILGSDEQKLADYFGAGHYFSFYKKHLLQNKIKITKDDFIAGEIPVMFNAMKKLGIDYKHDDYPDPLKKYLHRRIWETKLGYMQDKAFNDYLMEPVFIKPKDKLKKFTGFVLNSRDDWKLTPDDPPNMNLLAHYYPTMGLSKGNVLVDVTDYKYELKDYVTKLPYYSRTMIRNELSIPCFYLHYRDNWCWTTKQPFPAEIDKHMGYSCSAMPVIPNIFKLVTNDREDRYSGDNWIEFNGKRFVIGDLYELEQAYQALDLEINFLYFGNNDGKDT